MSSRPQNQIAGVLEQMLSWAARKTQPAQQRKEPDAAREIPFMVQVDDHVLRTKEGDYVRVWKVRGIPHESADYPTLNAAHEQLCLLLRSMAGNKISFWSHVVRRRWHPPTMEFGHGGAYADAVHRDYSAKLEKEQMFINELYLSVVYRPTSNYGHRLFQRVSTLSSEEKRRQTKDTLQKFEDIAKTIESGLADFSPEALGVYFVPSATGEGGTWFSQILEFYAYLINGYSQQFPVVRRNIQAALMTSRPIFRKESGYLLGPSSEVVIAALGVKVYPNPTQPGHLDKMLGLPFEFVLTQSAVCMDEESARNLLVKKSIRMRQAEDEAVSQQDEITAGGKGAALDDIKSGRTALVTYHFVWIIKAANRDDLRENIARAQDATRNAGMILAREDAALGAAFWSQLPGNYPYRPRPVTLTTHNYAGLVSFHNYPIGRATKNWWGDAVALLRNAHGPYYFNFHQSETDWGHTLLIGPTGSGKSVFAQLMTLMLRRLGTQGVVFDYNRSSEISVRAQGGSYYMLQNGVATGFNPFQLEPTPENIDFVKRLMRRLVTLSNPVLSARRESDLNDAVHLVFTLPKELRTLASLLRYFVPNEEDGIAERLRKWANPSELGWVFGNHEDTLVFNDVVTGFDVTAFLNHPEVRVPVMMYLFHRANMLLDGKRRVYVEVEECWKALDDAYFAEFLKDMLKTMRMKNAIIIPITQSAEDLMKSRISSALIEQAATIVLFPNTAAREEDYCNGIGLTERELLIVKTLRPRCGMALVKQGNTSVVVQLDLTGLDDHLAVLSGTKANVNLLDTIRQRVGDDPIDFLPVFHRERRVA